MKVKIEKEEFENWANKYELYASSTVYGKSSIEAVLRFEVKLYAQEYRVRLKDEVLYEGNDFEMAKERFESAQ